ncbi:MAG: hypothetical protein HUU31_25040 [Anaerolineae bacterium]|nr:hypothetical protein [Anaerolineae bacterium]
MSLDLSHLEDTDIRKAAAAGISEIERNAWAVTIAATERHSTHHAD